MRDFESPGRSAVRTMNGMAATSHPLATMAAMDMLRVGGNAMDAAVCAAAVLAVVEPQSTGIGGDCFALYVPKGQGKVLAYNGSGRAPEAASIDWYREHGFSAMPTYGPHSVTVPGAVDAWCRLLEDHGTKGLDAVLMPAIEYAEKGYVILDRVAFDWAARESFLAADEIASRMLLKDGRPLLTGEVHSQPELGATLTAIAKGGRDAFYRGAIAEDIVNRLHELGGLHSLEDFATARGEYVEPVSTRYRDYDIYQMPPNNQGLTSLLMLNILSGYDIGQLDPAGAERLHLQIEAGRLAYAVRDSYFGDMSVVDVPVEELLSQKYATRLRSFMSPTGAMTHLPNITLPSSDTIYLCVVDRDRNAVSLINSLFQNFGSCVTGPRSGVVLQNRGSSFRLQAGHPNALAPGKRPLHTIMPGMALKNGRVAMPFGVMGGGYQPFGNVQLLTSLIDFGADPQAALDAPRVFYQDGVLEVEKGIPLEVISQFQSLGHKVGPPRDPLGGGQTIVIDWEKGTLTGASDPRKDGCALGY